MGGLASPRLSESRERLTPEPSENPPQRKKKKKKAEAVGASYITKQDKVIVR